MLMPYHDHESFILLQTSQQRKTQKNRHPHLPRHLARGKNVTAPKVLKRKNLISNISVCNIEKENVSWKTNAKKNNPKMGRVGLISK